MDRAAALLEKLELPSGVYDRYLEQAQAFLDYALQLDPVRLPFRKPRLLRSKLFGRGYLVANHSSYVGGTYIGSLDASALLSVEAGCRRSPPLVLTAKRSGSARAYHWILEHEYVHIHQMLQGRMPVMRDQVGGPLTFLVRRAELEFEAQYLQLFHAGDHDSTKTFGMGLEQWCCFRSYTCSLEDTMGCLLSEQCSRPVALDFLENGAGRLSQEFCQVGPFPEFTAGYLTDFPRHVTVSLMNLCERVRGQLSDERVHLVKQWALANLPPK